MRKPRSEIILKNQPGLYHCRSVCVRRAFICGYDSYTGTDFSHRKAWIVNRLKTLVASYNIKIASYSIQSNHYHITVKTNPSGVEKWSPQEIIDRWFRIHPNHKIYGKDGIPKGRDLERLVTSKVLVELYRQRLGDLSWFMADLNSFIAVKANNEEDISGQFWDGRFRCRRLLDEAAVIQCMGYVDLNSIRNGQAERLEDCDFSSIQDRVLAHGARLKLDKLEKEPAQLKNLVESRAEIIDCKKNAQIDSWLCSLSKLFSHWGNEPSSEYGISDEEYIDLVEFTGRQIRKEKGKSGHIPMRMVTTLKRLEIDANKWIEGVEKFGGLYFVLAGKAKKIREAAKAAGRHWYCGLNPEVNIYKPG